MPAKKSLHRKTVEELNAISASKQMVRPGKWREYGLKNGVVPEEPRGQTADMVAMLLEMERRVAKRSPFYVAKYIMGRGQRRDGKLWGWNWRHIKLSQQMWWAFSTRTERPWGTEVYVEWCRGSRKSTMLQAALFCIGLNDPNLTMLLDGDVAKKVAFKSQVIRDLYQDDYVQTLWGLRGGPQVSPKWKLESWTLLRDVKTSDPTMISAGLDTSKTGGHFDVIASDDAQTDENADSPTINEDVKKNYRLYESLKSGKVCTVTFICGTRWGFRDLGADLQAKQDEEIRRGLPRSIFISRIAAYTRDKNGKLDSRFATFPEGGLTVGQLKRLKITMKAALFSYNYLLEPLSEDQATFKSQWVRHHDYSVTDMVRMGAKFYMATDTAGSANGASKGRKSDSSAIVVIAVTVEGDIFVMETRRLEKSTKLDVLNNVIEINESYPLDGAVGEEYFEGKKIMKWVREELTAKGIRIPWVKFQTDHKAKDKRIGDLEPYMQRGSLRWRKEHTDLEDQMLQHPKAQHDDLPDALALCVKVAIVPKRPENTPWYQEANYTETDEYKNLVANGKEPSYLSIELARSEAVRLGRVGRRRSRFRIPGGRR